MWKKIINNLKDTKVRENRVYIDWTRINCHMLLLKYNIYWGERGVHICLENINNLPTYFRISYNQTLNFDNHNLSRTKFALMEVIIRL